MRSIIITITIVLTIAAVSIVFFQMLATQNNPLPQTANPSSTIPTATPLTGNVSIENVAQGLYVPWSLVFTAPNRMLVTERNGSIRIINPQNSTLEDVPLKTFPEVSTKSEEGLMGMVLDPAYESNKFIYVAVAYPKKSTDGPLTVKIVRFKDEGTTTSGDTIILDGMPAGQNHAGTRLRFGPDSKLYISVGDATNREIAQDKKSLGGKILRINDDGSTPSDNPFPGSLVYSYGHRNSQGFDWNTAGVLYETEHGPSGFDGPQGGDEVNVIVAGGNYGWPRVSHERNEEGLIPNAIVFTPAVAPASGMFYKGAMFPEYDGQFLFGMLKGEGIMAVKPDSTDATKVAGYEKLPNIDYGRIRDVATGPDGAIYFSTSNRDGRGTTRDGDDHIYRIVRK